MEIKNRNYGTTFTFGLVVRGDLESITNLINFLNTSSLTVAHQEIGQNKMWIKIPNNNILVAQKRETSNK